jgi:hypothetical protein
MKRIKKISGLILKILDILVENLLCRNDEVITVLSKINESENRQDAKSAKDQFLRGLGCECFQLGAPVCRFAKPVGVSAVELSFYRTAKKHHDLLGDPWRSWRLGAFLRAYFGQE